MYIIITPVILRWPGSSVGIANGYGLDGPGIEYSLCRALNQGGSSSSYTGLVWEVEAIEVE
jgi:hypothetical protein